MIRWAVARLPLLRPGFRRATKGPARLARPTVVRARRAVLCGFVLIVAAHLGVNVAMDTTTPELRDPEYGCRLDKIRHLTMAHPDRPTLVALGSSRTQMGFCPDAMALTDEQGQDVIAFNFGSAGCGPVGQWLNLNRLLEAGIQPDYVLIEVLPPSLHMDGDGPNFVHLSRMSPADLRVLRPYCSDPEAMYEEWAELRLDSISTVRFNLMCKLLPNWVPFDSRVDYLWENVDSHGWLPYPHADVSDETRSRGVERARGEYQGQLADFHVSPIPDRAIRDLLSKCRELGIPAALYRMPEGESFRSMYPPDALEKINAYLNALCTEYDVPLFDAAEWINEHDFSDGHHLLRRGAEQFSSRFGNEAVEPWLQQYR